MPSQAASHDSLSKDLQQLHLQAIANCHRRLLVLTGGRGWAMSVLQCLPAALVEQPGLWVGSENAPHMSNAPSFVALQGHVVPAKRCRQVLGRQFGWVVFDDVDGVDPDALGASSGTLAGGGLFILLQSCSANVPQSMFVRWFEQRLDQAEAVLRVTESGDEGVVGFAIEWGASTKSLKHEGGVLGSDVEMTCESTKVEITSSAPDCLTEDQSQAVTRLLRVVEGHRRRPLVLSADRGRGKSAALGIAAARLMLQRRILIRVTAPSIAAVEPLFQRLAELLPQSTRRGNRVEQGESQLEFIALDLLLQQCPSLNDSAEIKTDGSDTCGLLLVDEAAAIPAPMLERLLRHHARIAFATTTHGYEGSGRGFQLRFRRTLDRLTPNWHRFELRSPIRWRAGDPLERWVFDALMLDAETLDEEAPATDVPGAESNLVADLDSDSDSDFASVLKKRGQAAGRGIVIDRSRLRFRCWSSQQLIDNPRQLKQLFALLVQAHYRTKPSDLRDLLDDPTMKIWLLHQRAPQQNQNNQRAQAEPLVGVLWVASEGGFDAELANSVWLGKRRPRGHLLPQVLTAQAGWRQAARLNYWRIIRVAVPEPLRRQGLGAELVQQLISQAQHDATVDIVATSFGATADLLPFWSAQQLQPLRLGVKADASSGCVSLVYGRGCSEAGQALVGQISRRFADDLPQQLRGCNRELEPELVVSLLRQAPPREQLSEQDWLDLYSFVYGQRQLQQVDAALYRWTLWQLSKASLKRRQALPLPLTDSLPVTLQTLLVRRFLQAYHWQDLLPGLRLSGPRQAEQWLRQQLRVQLDGCDELVALRLVDAQP